MTKNKIKNVIILAGGKGTRLSEQTKDTPKPLITVGPDPAIFHIMRHFIRYGVTNIIVAGGYKFDLLARAISNKLNVECPADGNVSVVKDNEDPLHSAKITVLDTGYNTDTAERIRLSMEYIKKTVADPEDHDTFVTYGDTFSDVNLDNVSDALYNSDNVAVVTAVQFYERFGIMKLDPNNNNQVTKFVEKSQSVDEFINGGFIACRSKLSDLMYKNEGDFSKVTLPALQEGNLLGAYKHQGFWFAMDSQRDWEQINEIYNKDPENFLK